MVFNEEQAGAQKCLFQNTLSSSGSSSSLWIKYSGTETVDLLFPAIGVYATPV